MNALGEMITSSVLTRALATVFLFMFLIAVLGVWATKTILGEPIDPVIWGTIISGAGICLTIAGINYGVNLQPAKAPGQAGAKNKNDGADQGGNIATTPNP